MPMFVERYIASIDKSHTCRHYYFIGIRTVAADGERCKRCQWQIKRVERVAAVGRHRTTSLGVVYAGHRNRKDGGEQ